MRLLRGFTSVSRPSAWLSSQCGICRGWGRQRVCADCLERHAPEPPRCVRCALEVPAGVRVCGHCLTDPPSFDRCVAALTYGYPWDALITRFKFDAALDLAPLLADRLLLAQRRAGADPPGLLLPVPLSAQRLRERGYNQAWEIARRLGRELHAEASADLLLRIKDTPHQLQLPLAQRSANVQGAFAIEPARLAGLRGREVTLVDDVLTTGATANEIAKVLLRAGAVRVQLWVVARTPRRGDA